MISFCTDDLGFWSYVRREETRREKKRREDKRRQEKRREEIRIVGYLFFSFFFFSLRPSVLSAQPKIYFMLFWRNIILNYSIA